MPRILLVWLLAAGTLGSMRWVAAWGAEQDPGDIPSLIRGILPDAPPAQNSDLEFDELFHHFGSILEGAVVEHEFPFRNGGDVPIVIERARHCGCLKLELPRDVPIAPGEEAVLLVRLDSRGRTGVQVKPIELTTDEDGEGPHTGVLMKGKVHSPVILRRSNVVWTSAGPGESRRFEIPLSADEDAGRPEISSSNPAVDALLEDFDGENGILLIDVTAPDQPGTLSAEVIVASQLGLAWDGVSWQKAVPIRVSVLAPFKVMGPGEVKLGDEPHRLTIRANQPEELWITELRCADPSILITRLSRPDQRKLVQFELRREAGSALAAGTTVDIYTNLCDDEDPPVLTIPVIPAD